MAGESARNKAMQARQKAERLLADAEKWERGAAGEARTAEALMGLGPDWVVWHDLSWPGRRYANLDHLAIGPTGVFVIDSKNWSGSVTVRDGVLRQNGYPREREVEACGEAALAVGRLVPEFIHSCFPVICFVDEQIASTAIRDVALCTTSTLVPTLTSRRAVLAPEQVAQIVRTLQTQMTTKNPSSPAPPKRTGQRRPATSRRTRPTRRRRSPARALARFALSAVWMVFVIAVLIGAVQSMSTSISQTSTDPTSGRSSPSATP